ncbi:hypothetical protein JET95_28880 [Pseudomonas aeruginosa]|nr:hypothetical protein [Pseudomonas aeruginosa]
MVLEFCIEKGLSITAQFSKLSVKNNIFLQLSLEKTFALIEPYIKYNLTHFGTIKNDLVNWRGQNQEHHAFAEGSLNFVHSKTSKEIFQIHDAIRLLECQLFTLRKKASRDKFLADLSKKIEWSRKKMPGLARALAAVQQERQAALGVMEKRAAELEEELKFIERCLKSVANQDQVEDRPAEQPPVTE